MAMDTQGDLFLRRSEQHEFLPKQKLVLDLDQMGEHLRSWHRAPARSPKESWARRPLWHFGEISRESPVTA